MGFLITFTYDSKIPTGSESESTFSEIKTILIYIYNETNKQAKKKKNLI